MSTIPPPYRDNNLGVLRPSCAAQSLRDYAAPAAQDDSAICCTACWLNLDTCGPCHIRSRKTPLFCQYRGPMWHATLVLQSSSTDCWPNCSGQCGTDTLVCAMRRSRASGEGLARRRTNQGILSTLPAPFRISCRRLGHVFVEAATSRMSLIIVSRSEISGVEL